MNNWKDLIVWRKAHEMVIKIYNVTKFYPPEEAYRLVDQICRSASSVPANIVEGQSRDTTKDYLKFLYNARGSLEETRYHLLLSRDLGYLNVETYNDLERGFKEVSLMLNSLIKSLKGK